MVYGKVYYTDGTTEEIDDVRTKEGLVEVIKSWSHEREIISPTSLKKVEIYKYPTSYFGTERKFDD